jgi:hypothetical protein
LGISFGKPHLQNLKKEFDDLTNEKDSNATQVKLNKKLKDAAVADVKERIRILEKYLMDGQTCKTITWIRN